MKKILSIAILIVLSFTISACNKAENTVYVGVNAEILEIIDEVQGFVVKGLDKDSMLGEKCYINCESPDMYFIYADNETEEVTDLNYNDFEVGDEITVDIKSVENKCALTSRVQLISQRK